MIALRAINRCTKSYLPIIIFRSNQIISKSLSSDVNFVYIVNEKRRKNSFPYQIRELKTSLVNREIVAFKLSDIGEGISEVLLKEWFVKVGDRVSQFDSICEVQSDKASVTITSRYDGVVKKLYYEVDDTAKVGLPLIDIERENDESSNEQIDEVSDQLASKSGETLDEKIHHYEEMDKEKVLTTPAVRKLAAENSVRLSDVQGTGKDGRILKEDVIAYIKQTKESAYFNSLPPPTATSTTTSQPKQSSSTAAQTQPKPVIKLDQDRTEKIKGVAKVMVKTMSESLKVPHFNFGDEIDLTNLIQLKEQLKEETVRRQVRLSFMPFMIKAASLALKQFPILNASVDENCETITYKAAHNIGVAMDTQQGLIVPNVKNVQSLTIFEIAKELNRLQDSASKGQISSNDLKGGTFTLSNIGAIGGKFGIPIMLHPEVAIGAIGKVIATPRFDENGAIRKAMLMTVVWSADHRIIDGATVCRFSDLWRSYIEQPQTMIMDLN